MKRRNDIGRTVRRTAVCGILCALSLVMLLIGAIIEVLDFSAAILAALPVLFCLAEMGYSYAALTYGATTLLGLLLLPGTKFPVLLYALCGGIYPILKKLIERVAKPWSFVLKAIFVNVDAVVIWFLSEWLMPDNDPLKNVWMIVFFVGMWLVFALYDVMLVRMETMYWRYLRKRLRIKDI